MAYNPKDFAYRDSLPSGDPEKVISGIDFDNEFQAIKRELDALDTELHPDGGSGDLVHEPPNTGKNYVRQGGTATWKEIGTEFIDDTNLVSEDPDKDLGAESRRWNKLWTNELDASGDVNIGGDINVDGSATIGGDISVDGNANIDGVLTIEGGIEIGSEIVDLEDFMQKTAINIVNEDWQVVLYEANGATPVININSDGVSAPEFIGDGAKITGIETDQLDDVQSAGAKRDDFLIYSGTQWVAEPFHIETELAFMGAWDFTAAPPPGPAGGDLYINDTGGAMHSGWGALAGSNVLPGNMVGWSDAKARWFLLGDVASSAVVQIVEGDCIVVDETQPDRPIVGLTQDSQNNIALGVEAHGWGNHANENYLTDFTETDPTVPSHVKTISTTNIANWNTAYGWDNHATQGYLKAGDMPSTDLSNYYTKSESDSKYELKFAKNNAFNKSFGTTSGTVAQGNHTHSEYLTSVNLNGYATESWVTSGFQPKGNYLISSDLNGYATESWVAAGYQPKGSYAASNHNHSGVYQPAGNYALVGASYTKAESDAKYELKGAGGGGGLPDGDWHCTGSITAVGNITAYSSSDERLKDDIETMPVGLIDDIKPSTWNWKEGGKASGGVVAQQLQSCGLEQWVNEAPNGDLGVDYNALIGVLLAEVQSLKARVKDLENAH